MALWNEGWLLAVNIISTWEIGATQLCSIKEMAPKAPFLCVNGSLSCMVFGVKADLDGMIYDYRARLAYAMTSWQIVLCKFN